MKNAQFHSDLEKVIIFTEEIRVLKFEPDTEIGRQWVFGKGLYELGSPNE